MIGLRLFLAQFRAFWRLSARLDDAGLAVRRAVFALRSRVSEEAESSSAVRHIVRLTLFDFTVAVALSAGVWWANTRLTFLNLPLNDAAYVQFVSGVAGIGAVFIGLYYAAVTAAMTAVYAQTPVRCELFPTGLVSFAAGLRRVLKRLSRFPLSFPRWTATSLVQEQHEVRFDVNGYSRLQAAYQAVSVRNWGWSGRDTSLNHWTEYYLFDRTLRFQHALALLRQHVVGEINQLLTRRLQLDVQISLEGLPSADEVLRVRERMATGEVSLGEAYDQVH